MQCFMYNARPIELRGRPKRALEAFTVFRVERASGGALLAIRIGRDRMLHTDRRFDELAAVLVPVEFLLEQDPEDEPLRTARKSVERQLWSWRCEESGLARELGALLLALIDTGTLSRRSADELLRRFDDEPGWSFDRLYQLALSQLSADVKKEAPRDDASTGGGTGPVTSA